MFPLVRSRSRSRFFGAASTLNFNFVDGSPFPGQITFTRASSATRFNSSGVLETVGNDVARLDFNPSTLAAQGLLIEEQRTNSIRNNTMVGAVAGTPGTLPTNWAASTVLTGLTRTIATGTENGIAYIDVRLNGTPSASGRYDIFYETSTQVAALNGQTWTNSGYFKLQAGTLSGVTAVRLYFEEKNSGGAYLIEQNTTITNPTSAALSTQRASATRTLNQATTAFLLSGFNLLLDGTAIDITLRIGLPQLELGAFATSVIPTTTTALTRSADVASVNTLTPWFNAAAGTFYTEFSVPQLGRAGRLVAVDDGSLTNMIDMTVSATNGVAIEAVVAGVYGGFASAVGSISANTTQKSAFTFSASDSETACLNAGAVGSGAVTLPSVSLTRLLLGRQSNGVELCGHLRRITYYPRRLANAQLQALTA